MKNQLKKMASFLLSISLAFVMLSCEKEFDKPPVIVPKVNFPSNTTIATLKATYLGAMIQITDTLVIQGIITSSDETGNIYKSLYIQDSTGGLNIAIDQTSIYTDFRLGQKIFIKCKDLYLGEYGGVVQLGYNNNGSIGRIPTAMLKTYFFKDGLPGAVPTPSLIDVTTDLTGKISMLVRIDGISFPDVGQPYSLPDASTDRIIADASGNPISIGGSDFVLRTSNYASFRTSLLPQGVGSLIGILSVYNGTYQLYIRDLNDVVGFVPDSSTIILNEPFASSLGGFTQFSVSGAELWHWATYTPSTYAAMSGYSGGVNNANEDWLISPSLDFTSFSSIILKFSSAMKFATIADNSLKFFISSDYTSGDPTTATWTEFTVANLPAGINWTFVPSGDIDLSATGVTGSNVHIAFKYTSTASVSASWELTNIVIKGTN